MSDATVFAYALQSIEGVGRVTAHRLLKHFTTYDDLLAFPREQVLVRIKGAPNAERLVQHLFDRLGMERRFNEAQRDLEQLARRSVLVTAPHDPLWPAGLNDLSPSERPVLLYSYGDRAVLSRPTLALFARPPVPGPAYELAQELAEHLLQTGAVPVTGASHGFDVVFHKLANLRTPPRPSALVAACGLGRIPGSLRPVASSAVKAGGIILSSFPLGHGPYEHDDRERALLQAAISRSSVFVDPQPDTPEWSALLRAVELGRAVFAIDEAGTSFPQGVTLIRTGTDFDAVLRTLQPSS